MKLKVSIGKGLSDSELAKIKAENTKKVIALIKQGKTADGLSRFPYKYPEKFIDEVMKLA